MEKIVIRLAGDSGDGIQLAGSTIARTATENGLSVLTLPDFPSEIRAPEGTLYGVSAYQVQIGDVPVSTPGDRYDLLIALNPSALKNNISHLKKNGTLIINTSSFTNKNLKLSHYDHNPLDDKAQFSDFQLIKIDLEAELHVMKSREISPKTIRKSKNFFVIGLVEWLLNLSISATTGWIEKKFHKDEEAKTVNGAALKLGFDYGNQHLNSVKRWSFNLQGTEKIRRNITGNQATAKGLVTAAQLSGLPLFLGSYPITPATDILHFISGYKKFGVKHLQAEDEIAGISSAIGASFGGYLAATTTSGPGLALKTEALGLALMTELPLVVVNVMRGGPSTGLPTKPEQSDLFHAVFGRHGDAPLPVIAASSPADCFFMTIEAARLALKYMTPVILLTDGYIGQSSESWEIPDEVELPELAVSFIKEGEEYQPYARNEFLARPWAVPGIAGAEHRIGGLEKQFGSGNVSHDPENHQRMSEIRRDKVNGMVREIPETEIFGPQHGDQVIVSWGGTYGAVREAVKEMHYRKFAVSHIHLKYLNPLPADLKEKLSVFEKITVAELNMGQLSFILKAHLERAVDSLTIVEGRPMLKEDILTIMNKGHEIVH